uniref:Major facilitator superfamily (MFS) profile domain-containing protein n=1 Tax=Kwoniella bestiolae CBS 10118 TaxID=1296100 RepID=A0A1B9GFB6_9TREE|nr:hypothetical protein I302_01200 [Kwoniella bestiolae CBS 10118]OCF29688.1 hypothetical protein I302_01200 [Kwoniella bestiolae CBS 10118]
MSTNNISPAAINAQTEKAHDEHVEGSIAGDLEKGKNLSTGDAKNSDLGAAWLDGYEGPRTEITDEENESVRKRIDAFLLPMIFIVYFTQQLDKSSLSFASVFGLKTDAHLEGQQYSWLSSLVYFAQLVFQPYTDKIVSQMPVNVWISICFFGWGASLCIMSAFTSFAGLAVWRFILGAFEASISPSMLVVVSMWWTRREQPLRNNIWYSANGMATILGSLITYGLGQANTSLHPYQLIFLVCGLIAVVLSIPFFLLFPGHPTKARWLNDHQKYISLERIRLNNTGTQSTTFKWSQVKECVLDPKTWFCVVNVFCISLVSGGITTFGPLILQGFGLSTFQTILYNMIPGAIGIVSNILSALAVTYTKRKFPVLLVASAFPLAAAAALYTLPRGAEHKSQLLGVYFILQVYQCISPIFFSWQFANTAGHTKKTTTTGMLFIGLSCGNIVGPQLYKSSEAPYYHTGLTGNLIVLCVMFGLIICQGLYLHALNKRNIRRRIAKGKTGAHIDLSLEDSSRWKELRERQRAGQALQGQAEGEEATDLQNEDFIYSL